MTKKTRTSVLSCSNKYNEPPYLRINRLFLSIFAFIEVRRLSQKWQNSLLPEDSQKLSENNFRKNNGGGRGIRTPDTALQPYNGLANRRLQPLGHPSGAMPAGAKAAGACSDVRCGVKSQLLAARPSAGAREFASSHELSLICTSSLCHVHAVSYKNVEGTSSLFVQLSQGLIYEKSSLVRFCADGAGSGPRIRADQRGNRLAAARDGGSGAGTGDR